ncbi:MFS transporter [Lacrimispora amygdalina]|uniref:MFS transporter n=1 Tax=Lacrimispora amygdalina TaxID=253257 RepID=UPI000BE2A377|nr:MFS transporter [Lacrimispora amygdalina]
MNVYKKNSRNLFAAVIFFWFAQYVYIPFQTPYLTGIGTSAGMVGMIIGAYGISQMLLRLPVGVLADCRNRHKRFIIIGGLSSGIASIFRIIMQNGTGFFIANLFSGLASAMWISFMVLYMSFYPSEQQKATCQLVVANNLGMLAGFVTSTLFYQKLGMPVICMFSVIAGICCAFTACGLKKTEYHKSCNPDGSAAIPGNMLCVCLNRRLLFFAVLALVQQGVQMSTTMSFTTQIIKNLGADTIILGLSCIIYMLSAVIWAKFASTKACSVLSSKNWIFLVFCTTAGYCILIPMSTSIPVICLLQILPGMATGILFSFLTAEAMKSIPAEKKSTAMGCFQAIYAFGMTVFPIICGKIAGAFSMTAAYLFLAVICVIAAVGSRCFRQE